MSDTFVTLTVDDAGVGTILLDRPPMNALSPEVQGQLRLAAEEAADRPDVRCVVVYGGEKIFAAGADIKSMQQVDHDAMVVDIERLQPALGALAGIPKPTFAAISGFALGGGLEIALACDFRIVSESSRLGLPEISLGLIPGGGGTQRLARLVGPARAKDMVFTGRHVRADEALAIGLVDAVVPKDEVYAEAVRRAAVLATGPALALRAAKQAIDQGLSMSLEGGLALERHLFASLFASRDAATGMRSFIDNGPGKAVFGQSTD